MFCGSFYQICVDNYYNTILPYFYLYYFNDYVGSKNKLMQIAKNQQISENDFSPHCGFSTNMSVLIKRKHKKIGPMAVLTVEVRKDPFRKTTLPSLWISNDYAGAKNRLMQMAKNRQGSENDFGPVPQEQTRPVEAFRSLSVLSPKCSILNATTYR